MEQISVLLRIVSGQSITLTLYAFPCGSVGLLDQFVRSPHWLITSSPSSVQKGFDHLIFVGIPQTLTLLIPILADTEC